jgi:hypothetical protein
MTKDFGLLDNVNMCISDSPSNFELTAYITSKHLGIRIG